MNLFEESIASDADTSKGTYIVPPVTTYNVTTYAELVAALAAAASGDTINLAVGTYTGPLAITANVTINGANAGIAGNGARGAESIIDGAVTANAGVTINGVQFLNSSDNSTDFNALTLSGSANATITNSRFVSTGPNGNNDRAITMDTSATGQITISNNYFGGASTGMFSTANWSRAIWSDGASSLLAIQDNLFEFVRTAINLDGFNNAATTVSGNQFTNSGSGISIGTPTGSTITGITNNVFTGVGTDFNLRNVTTAQSFDLTATNNSGGGVGGAATLYILGTAGADTITGSAGADILDARDITNASFADATSNTLNGGGGDDRLIGSLGGDTLNGGEGNDTVVAAANGGTDTFAGGAGDDTLDLRNVGAITATASGATTTYSYAGGSVAATGVETILYTGSLTVNGGATDDIINTGDGNETINGNDGNDIIESGGGNDIVNGGGGDDIVIGGSGAGDDYYDGGAGTGDLLTYPSTTLGIVVDMNEIDRSANPAIAAILTGAGLPTNTAVGIATGAEIGTDAFRNFENVTGGSGDDVITGNSAINVINGGGGDDLIVGGGGNDTMDGGLGNDTLSYAGLTNAVQVNLITGQVNAGAQGGTDSVANFENVILGNANDQFIGSEGENNVEGGLGDDQIDGRGGLDSFFYTNVVATDGMAQQVFDVLRINAGIEGTDFLTNMEQVRFTNGEDVLTVLVNAGNAVVASRDDAGAMDEGDVNVTRTAATGVLSNDVNLDQGGADLEYVFAVNGSAANVGQPIVGTYGTLTLNADGSYTYVQNQAATNGLSEGEVVTDSFTYQADDNDTGDSVAANLVFTITGVNDAPTTGGTATGTLTEDVGVDEGDLVASGALTVSDPDDDESAYQPDTFVTTEGGTFTIDADGDWDYFISNSDLDVQSLGATQTLLQTFNALTVDGTEVPITVTINGTNDNPVVSGVSFTSPTTLIIAADSANGTLATAIALTAGSLTANPEIYNSSTVPHVTIVAATDANPDFYSYSFVNAVIQDPNTLFTVDMDQVSGTTPAALTFYFNGAELLTTTTDRFGAWPASPPFDVPSPGTLPSGQLGSGTFTGTIQIRVGSAASGGTVGLGVGNGYVLHVSLPSAPVAPPGNLLTETNGALTTSGNVAFSDIDANDDPVASYDSATGFAFTLANGLTLTPAQQTALAAAFTVEPDGDFSFNVASPDYLGHDDVLTLTYTVVVNDQHGGSTSTPVTITINGSNDGPVITSVAQTATLAETNAALTASGTVTASDVDNGDILTFTAGTITVVETGTTLTGAQETALAAGFAVSPTGAWTYNVASPDYLPEGSSVVITATVNVADGHGGTTSQNVTITINGSNDAPTIDNPDDHEYDLDETNATLSLSGTVDFSDVDIGDTPEATFDAEDVEVTATGLTLTEDQIADIVAGFTLVDGTGSYEFEIDSPDYLAAGDVITATFDIHVVDADGGDTVQQVVITITGTNDAPVLTGGSLGSITDTVALDEFAPLTGTLVPAVADIDNHDTMAFTLNGPAESAYGTLTLNTDGTYSFAANDAAINGLLTGDNPTVTYSVTVTDSGGATSTANFTIAISGSNENPRFITSPLYFETGDNHWWGAQFDLLEGAYDPDNVPSPDLDITNVNVASWSTNGEPLTGAQQSLVFSAMTAAFASGNFSLENGTLSFDPTLFDFLDHVNQLQVVITYDVTDTNGGSSPQTATIVINGQNEYGESTPYDDNIVGGNFGDDIYANDGDDIVIAGAGADRVDGADGDDYIEGGSGNDELVGGNGDDEIYGGSGDDLIVGDNFFFPGGGDGIAMGGPSWGTESGDNLLDGGSGNDEIITGLGNNIVRGGSGDDNIYLYDPFGFGPGPRDNKPLEEPIEFDTTTGFNQVDGGTGFDTAYLTGDWSEYTITRTGTNSYTFERPDGEGGTESNTFTNVEYFVFADGEGTAAELANDGPTVEDSIFTVSELPEDADTAPGYGYVGNVGADDLDLDLGDELRYFLTGSGAEYFEIDSYGNIRMVNPLDYETDPRTFDLTVRVVDSKGLEATASVTINVTDVDEPVRPINVSGNEGVEENSEAGTVVLTASAVDPDEGSTVVYSLEDDAGGRFVINAATGVVSVSAAGAALLDFETAESHEIVIRASSGESSRTSTVTVNVNDVEVEEIVGTEEDNVLTGDNYRNLLLGLGGDDVLAGRGSADILDGGNGIDTADYSGSDGAVFVNLSTQSASNDGEGSSDELLNIENVTGSANDDVLIGNDLDNILVGGNGADYLIGLGGDDTLDGGAGAANALQGGLGDDIYIISATGDSAVEFAGEGTDEVQTALSTFTLNNEVETLVYTGVSSFVGAGNSGDNRIVGGTMMDILIGLEGNDTILGGSGAANELYGGNGDDTYILSAVGDSIIELGGAGTDTVRTALGSHVLGANVENLVYTGSSSFVGIGNAGDNVISGGVAADILTGGAGADTFLFEGPGARDTINDFVSGVDRIALGAGFAHTAAFSFIQGTGALAATTANSTFIYNSDSGTISYDADGNGAGAAVDIAYVGTGLTLNIGDFMFV